MIGEHDTSVLDPALWSTVENPEAGAMLKIGDWPLYTFAADEAPGDVNGQGVGEVWYAVAPDGSLIEGDITVAEFAAGATRRHDSRPAPPRRPPAERPPDNNLQTRGAGRDGNVPPAPFFQDPSSGPSTLGTLGSRAHR